MKLICNLNTQINMQYISKKIGVIEKAKKSDRYWIYGKFQNNYKNI